MRTRLALVVLLFAMTLSAKVINFEQFPGDGNGFNRTIGTTYNALGVTFTPSTQGVCGGNSMGDPGGWGLEGTNGPQFLCFNGINPGYTVTLDFVSPQSKVAFDHSSTPFAGVGGEVTVDV
jgi:hypothetical protein